MSRSALQLDTDGKARDGRRGFLRLAGGAGTAGLAAVALTGGRAGAQESGDPPPAQPPAPAGVELGYAETTAEFGTTKTATVPNLALSAPVDGGPLTVEYGGFVKSSIASGPVVLTLLRDGTPVHQVGGTVAGAGGVVHVHGLHRIPAGQTGTATFTVQLANLAGRGTARLVASPLSPAFLLARKV